MSILGNGYPAIDLAGARVLITGGGRGIGQATAELFARRGSEVAIADVDIAAAQAVAGALRGRAFELDVRARDQWDKVVADLGRVDILINNAGVMPAGPFLVEPDAVGHTTIDVNVWGLIHGMRAVVPDMIERGRGHVVNVASLAGKVPIPGLAVYNASKFAAVGLSAATRLEFAEHGVSVSCVMPAAVRTRLAAGFSLGVGVPMVEPGDVAAAIVKTCRTRRAEVAVPGYLGAVDVALAAAPEPAVRIVRRLFNGESALHPTDEKARAAYESQIRAITTDD
ncbi:SDR family NAD(P)-dependent oxidoreductase [Nocardia sp. CDC159]|uniref:SDR family NAD(P)-dependent oxidoreductase n=1 Tax=Nocardia pulmonis TaxID=2951408 RepID=A0A9X2EC92_9NOCA|nr:MULTISPECIES: SDR family NAD(P)-dependent oxidoreductase [Nocardia]MCM6777784.1 SDR family NAD(P)-dependent oxidoreductase [Nocardia pulmonis]MCM6790669.1 SDR family NAD(P)-dependent oxidoreductase [Nocardia sp. CDC159]